MTSVVALGVVLLIVYVTLLRRQRFVCSGKVNLVTKQKINVPLG